MVNLHQRDKNAKLSHQTLLPYEKDEMDSAAGDNQVHHPNDTPDEISGAEFLLSIAGMFESEETDISENVERYVAQALRKKYP